MKKPIGEEYGIDIIKINNKYQLRKVEGYYYRPEFIDEPSEKINGILFRDYREYDAWEVIWSLSEGVMDVGVTGNERSEISYLIEQHVKDEN